MDGIPQEIKDKLQKVCICRGITAATIKEHIREGKRTLGEIATATGATQGGCKGHRCSEKIQNLIKAYEEGEWQ
ncbi:MAG: (2Fe-2S)-binding protein [Cellulosilyticaceae bacterium]